MGVSRYLARLNLLAILTDDEDLIEFVAALSGMLAKGQQIDDLFVKVKGEYKQGINSKLEEQDQELTLDILRPLKKLYRRIK